MMKCFVFLTLAALVGANEPEFADALDGECAASKCDGVSMMQKKASKDKIPTSRFGAMLEDLVPVDLLEEKLAQMEKLGFSRSDTIKQLKAKLGSMSELELAEAKVTLGQSKPLDSSRNECVAAKAASAAYRFGGNAQMMGSIKGRDDLLKAGWEFLRSFNKTNVEEEKSDVDHLGWWVKRDRYHHKGECMFVFQGSDSDNDFVNNFLKNPITYRGLPGIHEGIANEIEGLVSQIEWDRVKGVCRKGLTIVGHSLGGGLAQLLALLLTHKTDPLGAKVQVSNLFTFGAMSLGAENWPNDDDANGCFPGSLFFNARTNSSTRQVEVDIVTSVETGGDELEPVKSDKYLLFAPSMMGLKLNSLEFECGNLIPKYGSSGFDLHMIQNYEYNLGCIDFLDFMMYMINLMGTMAAAGL